MLYKKRKVIIVLLNGWAVNSTIQYININKIIIGKAVCV